MLLNCYQRSTFAAPQPETCSSSSLQPQINLTRDTLVPWGL